MSDEQNNNPNEETKSEQQTFSAPETTDFTGDSTKPPADPPPNQPKRTISKDVGFVDAIQQAISFLKLDFSQAQATADNSSFLMWGFVFMAIGGVAMAFGQFNPIGVIIYPIAFTVGGGISLAIMWVIAGPILGGKASIQQHYSFTAILFIISWVSVIPILGNFIFLLLELYLIYVFQQLYVRVHKLSEGKAWFAVLIPVILCFVMFACLIITFGMAIFGAAAAAGQ